MAIGERPPRPASLAIPVGPGRYLLAAPIRTAPGGLAVHYEQTMVPAEEEPILLTA